MVFLFCVFCVIIGVKKKFVIADKYRKVFV